MRKNRRNKGDIIIDITSLLDIVFIILLIVVCNQSRLTENLEDREVQAKEAVKKAEAEAQLYAQQLETMDNLNQYVWAASIVVPFDEKEITKRQIMLLKEGESIETYELSGNYAEPALDSFKSSLERYIESNDNRPVILSLNEEDEKILYRDEKAIAEILEELSSTYANVYIKGRLGEEQE